MHTSRILKRTLSISTLSHFTNPVAIQPSCHQHQHGHSGTAAKVPQLNQLRWKSSNKWGKMKAKFLPATPNFDYSGDDHLELPAVLDDGDSIFTKIGIDQSEIDVADKTVYSIQNADGREQMELLINKTREKFARDETDQDSLELKIATMTLHVRKLIKHVQQFPRDKRNKSTLVEAIQLRRSKLKALRAYDIKRFDWLCKELSITYEPCAAYNQFVPRKSRVRTEAITEMMEMKESKLSELRESLAKEREDYYSKKAEVMKAIKDQQDELQTETERLMNSQIETGYPGSHGAIAYQLAHIKIVDKEKWWRKHPEVMKRKYAGKPWKMYK